MNRRASDHRCNHHALTERRLVVRVRVRALAHRIAL